jgi:hypothetical protein
LHEGLGVDFRILDEGESDLEPYGISIGIAFLVFSVLIEKVWTITELSPISAYRARLARRPKPEAVDPQCEVHARHRKRFQCDRSM